MKIEGKWIGEYTYGDDYSHPLQGKSIAFEMDLVSRGIEFYGNFSDDETRSYFQNEGIVSGLLEGDYIEFDKQYPKTVGINEDGSIEILENIPPPIIKYQGTLINNQFEGSWEIHEYYEGEEGIFSMVAGTGTWSMSKPQLP